MQEFGLTTQQAEKLLLKFGCNKLPELKKTPSTVLFLKQFQNPLAYILLVLSGIAFIINHFIDASFILLVVLINGLVSFIQENKAEKTLLALKKVIKTKARVIRDKGETEIDSENLVPGDIIVLRPGDKVPADARLIEAISLKVEQAILTGEFWAVKKSVKQDNLVYLGTNIEQGYAKAIVIATGSNTKMGSLALTVQKVKETKTPLQKRIQEFSRILAVIVIIIGALIFVIGLIKGQSLFITAVALVVSAIPEGLLPVITLVLVVGMRRILKKHGLVRKLTAAETLGSAQVLCVDKTGTLTTGKMVITDVIAQDKNLAWQIITKCNEAIIDQNQIIGRATDRALLAAGIKAGFSQDLDKRRAFLPFNEEKKYQAALYPDYLYVTGAPELLLEMSQNKEENTWDLKIKKLAKQGFRLIGLACKKTDSLKDLKNLNFTGLAILRDPLRPDVKQSIKICERAGIRVVMATGDHNLTAKSIAQEIGFDVGPGRILNGSEINDNALKNIQEINVFSRVTPEQKLQIVQAWQEQGFVIAMTGDGVNDAPALKKADIGIALASGTDVAKEAADLVLLKNSFSTIVAAIEQGRILFENIKKAILYLLSNDFAEVFIVLFSVIFGLPLPLLPAQILWINIIEDTFPDFALAIEPGEKTAMQKKIQNRQILSPAVKQLIIFIGLCTSVIAFLVFVILLKFALDIAKIRTMIFALHALSSLFFVFSCRSLRRTILRKDLFENYWLNWAVVFGILLLLLAIYVPSLQFILRTAALTGFDWLIILAAASIDIALIEVFKYKFIIKKNLA